MSGGFQKRKKKKKGSGEEEKEMIHFPSKWFHLLDDRTLPEIRFEWTMERWRIRIRTTARGVEQYIFETRFPANGRGEEKKKRKEGRKRKREKRTMSCSGEALGLQS